MKRYRLVNTYPGCKWNLGEIVTEKEINKVYKTLSTDVLRNFFEDVKEDSIYYFENDWRPIKDLVYNEIKGRLWIWCEYPGGGEPRELYVDLLDTNPYIYCNVEFVNDRDKTRRLAQGAVCYSLTKNDKSPYKSEEHRNIWRDVVNLTRVRKIFYKKTY